MARKKRKPQRQKPAGRKAGKAAAETHAGIPERRAMEGALRELARGLSGRPATNTPLERAQELMDQALDARDEQRGVQLAQQALATAPDCADAYSFLAERAGSRKEALALYEQAVAAGERTLGRDIFEQAVGHFWGILETRPYMRARLGLATALWTAGRRDEAIAHLWEMLRLNPGDNQGVRYTLAHLLFFHDRDDHLARLLEQYADEGSATWAYSKTLLEFRRHGDMPEARRLLQEAKRSNKFVPAYLDGRKHPGAEQLPYYSPGAESEALEYIHGFLSAWKSTPGAIPWLRRNAQGTGKRKTDQASARGPLPQIKARLKQQVPQTDDAWQADYRQTPEWIIVNERKVRPWLVLVGNRSNGIILSHVMLETEPSAEMLWDSLVDAMQKPMAERPHRPAVLQGRSRAAWELLRPHLEEIGVQLTVTDDLDMLDDAFQELGEQISGAPQPGLLDVPGVTPELMADFYEAAAYFFEQKPWCKVGYESALKIECPKFQSGPWYGVLMGQSGLSLGLALYDDLTLLNRLLAGNLSDEENGRLTVATTMDFGEEWDIPVSDLEAVQRHGWRLASPDAYPSMYRKERGMSIRPPLAWEMELMTACLRSVPEHVSRVRQDNPARNQVAVPSVSGELRLTLSWVVEE